MVWSAKTLEIIDEETKEGIGRYCLVAASNEGGGLQRLCDHDHDSPAEAQNCPDAIQQGLLLGVPDIGKPKGELSLPELIKFVMHCADLIEPKNLKLADDIRHQIRKNQQYPEKFNC